MLPATVSVKELGSVVYCPGSNTTQEMRTEEVNWSRTANPGKEGGKFQTNRIAWEQGKDRAGKKTAY